MKIVVLVAPISFGIGHRKKSCISYYIETQKHKILFDLGMNDLFCVNLCKRSADISKIDTVVLSSGFSNSGGGLQYILAKNASAKIYVQQNAFAPHYTSVLGVKKYCGLDESLCKSPQLCFTNNLYFLDDNIQLLSNIMERRYILENSEKYFIKKGESYEPDLFTHEQYMIVEEEGKCVLFAGCPNNDISIIIKKAENICNREMDAVFSDFHLLYGAARKDENAEQIDECLKELKAKSTKYYTSEIGGKDMKDAFRKVLGKKMGFFEQGSVITL